MVFNYVDTVSVRRVMDREVPRLRKSFFHTTLSAVSCAVLLTNAFRAIKAQIKGIFGLNVMDGTAGTSDKSDVEHEQRKQRHFLMGINVTNPHLYTIRGVRSRQNWLSDSDFVESLSLLSQPALMSNVCL